jgi:predicted DNA-binding transcriptional regulator AlpA
MTPPDLRRASKGVKAMAGSEVDDGGVVEAARKARALEIAQAAASAKVLWRFCDLKFLGYATGRATLRRQIVRDGFPKPIVLGPNSVAWDAEEVRAWLMCRPRGSAPQPRRIEKTRALAAPADAGRPEARQVRPLPRTGPPHALVEQLSG